MGRYVELGHVIENGMPTYPNIPPVEIGMLLSHEESHERYGGRAEFALGRASIPGNTGTYIDSPFHRYRDADDLASLPLDALAGLEGAVYDARVGADRSVTIDASEHDVRGKAVLIRSGWDARWGSDSYWDLGPYLAPETIDLLREAPAALVGVDFWNVDDTEDPARPAHTRLLEGGVLIVEHMCNLGSLPASGFRFYAVPLRIVTGASFPVRPFAEFPE